ncbi:MAG: hypothetical protein K2X81_20185, partial [Candidatus Obscuribacterales bacterium]|nr:hypothetical protein [Candidatus Obscuribacterales bacterium]
GLVAGGALFGVLVALISIPPEIEDTLVKISCEPFLHHHLGIAGYQWLGVAAFAVMGITLFRIAKSGAAMPPIASVEDPSK